MFDHVELRVSDMAPYVPLMRVLAGEASFADDELVEWGDFGVVVADDANPITRGVHVGLVAPDVATIEAFWRAGLEAGFTDDGAPGPRREYGDDYVGGFLRDAHGNSLEACLHDNAGPPGVIDHLWLRVADLEASRTFYSAVSEFTRFVLVVEEARLVRFRGPSASFTLVAGGPVSSHLHVAIPTDDDASVHDFHAAALAAGGRDNGGPGERPQYHPGYYAAFALDPDGHNVEVVNHHR